MRYTFIFIIFTVFMMACNTGKSAAIQPSEEEGIVKKDTIRIENPELEYEIIIIEIGFESWLVTQRPESYFTQSFLEIRNQRYVSEYNYRVTLPSQYNSNIYNLLIDYNPSIDYGKEVNYLLYMYFEFFQNKYRQNLW